MPGGGSRGRGRGSGGDRRFEGRRVDPRFQRMKTEESKVEIDERFSGALAGDSSFGTTTTERRFDIRGMRRQPQAQRENLSSFYHTSSSSIAREPHEEEVEEDEDEDEEEEGDVEEEEEEGSEEEVLSGEEGTRRMGVMNMDWGVVRAVDVFAMLSSFLPKGGSIKRVTVYPSDFGLAKMAQEDEQGPPPEIFRSPDDEEDHQGKAEEGDEEDGNEEEEDEEEEDEEEEKEEEEKDPYMEGLEGMTEEELEKLLAEEESKLARGDDEEDEEEEEQDEEEEEEEEEEKMKVKAEKEEGDEKSCFDSEKLRKYELSRLRYYFAVVECDSVATAERLYDSCDGTELGRSANVMDLRFIPDDMDFSSREPRDTAVCVPADYQAPDFETKALQQTNVKLTWDQTPTDRFTALTRAVADPKKRRRANAKARDGDDESDEDQDDNDLKAYLAPPSDDEEEGEEQVRAKYGALLGGAGGEVGDEGDMEGDMEVTFTPGLTEAAEEMVKKREEKLADEQKTPWEKYLEKRKTKIDEKRKLRKEKQKQGDADDSDDDDDQDDGDGEPEKKRTKREQLELLMLDESGGAAPKREKEEDGEREEEEGRGRKKRLGKKKRREQEEREEEGLGDEDDFLVDTKDSRFASLYSKHDFAPDPTHPEFTSTKSMKAVLDARSQQRGRAALEEEKAAREAYEAAAKGDPASLASSELKSLSASLKRKSAKTFGPK